MLPATRLRQIPLLDMISHLYRLRPFNLGVSLVTVRDSGREKIAYAQVWTRARRAFVRWWIIRRGAGK